MADEFICEECAYSTPTEEKKCPLCGGRVVSIDDGIDDKAYAEANSEEESPMRDDFDFGGEELLETA